MEALAIQDGKIYAFVQSPIRNPVTLGNGALNAMQNVRLVEFDPATRATRQFLYVMDNPASLGADDTPRRQDRRRGRRPERRIPASSSATTMRCPMIRPVETITKKVYAFKLDGATDISALDALVSDRAQRRDVKLSSTR